LCRNLSTKREEDFMSKRSRDLAVGGGILCIMFLCLFVSLADAVQPVTVDKPASGDALLSREVFPIELTIALKDPRPSQYRLYARCGLSPWQIITIRNCDYWGTCPTKYYWEVPLVTNTVICKVGVQLLNANGVLGQDVSDNFTISPTSITPATVSVTPINVVDTPSNPGGVVFTVSGGTPPYKVATLLNSQIDFSITTIDGAASVQTYAGPSPVSFTVANSLTCGSDTTVIVGAQDATGAKTFSIYYINCP
jgi:hypothetical protein